jgi:hypothetical protein
VDIPLISNGKPGYGNFAIPDMDAALNPPSPQEVTVPGGMSVPSANGTEEPNLLNRIFGVLQVVGGAVQTVAGGSAVIAGLGLAPGTCGTSLVVTVAGGAVALNGFDNVYAGLRQAWTGKPTQTITSSSVEYVTGSHLAGEIVDIGIGIVSPGGVGKFANAFKRTCFTAGTQVVVGAEYNGEGNGVEYVTVNIEDIKVGDLVYTYDTITGEVSLKEVTDTFVRTSNHINYLTIIDENGHEQIIETTDSHPFWVVTDSPDLDRATKEIVDENGTILYHENIGATEHGYWVEAKDLKIGDVFLGVNGELSTLVSTERVEFPEGITVYNFTVDGNHDYFVIAQEDELGQTCILVHNAKYHDHHIVMKSDHSKAWLSENSQYIKDSQALLKKYGIDISDNHNLVRAENAGHTIEYASKVNQRLQDAVKNLKGKKSDERIKSAIYKALDKIASTIRDGKLSDL